MTSLQIYLKNDQILVMLYYALHQTKIWHLVSHRETVCFRSCVGNVYLYFKRLFGVGGAAHFPYVSFLK